jgi:multidrug efflux pump subunit AcrA (membrane-fusion protein)
VSRERATGSRAPLLPERPPRAVARATGWLVVGAFAAVIAAAVLVQVPHVLECDFVLEPAPEDVVAVRAPGAGVVARVHAREGDEREAGSVLAEIERSGGGDAIAVRAPFRAIVLTAADAAVGRVVEADTALMQVVPSDAPLRARLFLADADWSRVERGQSVRLLVDALPHERHGTFEARVVAVGAAAVPTDTGEAFPATAALADDDAHAHRRLRPGMRGRARVRVGERSVAESLLSGSSD